MSVSEGRPPAIDDGSRSSAIGMKQVVQHYRSGELAVLDVPVPACKPGGVLVVSLYSLISTGTELMKVSEARLSLLGKARARPDQVRKVVDSVAQVGPVAAYKKAMNRLDSYTPLGYSLCGIVIAVGEGAEEFAVGQVVACAGSEHALHAEVNWVPVNLCVPVPDGVDPKLAAFATVGAIALHGVRRSDVQLGDTACVVGLGLVGQLVVQLLVASGVRTVGIDPVEARCTLAEASGAVMCVSPSADDVDRLEQFLMTQTGGLGADHILLAAGGDSPGPVQAAARLARDRARVVDIGKCRMDLPWNEYYEKELDVRFSRSYGPGRYDDRYELEGVDYPAGYVRWTERRNLACFLDLVARSELSIAPLISEVVPFTDAADIYGRLDSGESHGVGFLFEYQRAAELSAKSAEKSRAVQPPKTTATVPIRRSPGATLRLGFIGAGNYASSMLLPHLVHSEGVDLTHVVTTTSLSAANAQRKFGFTAASTDPSTVLDDPGIDAVFIVTRHSSHAALACDALEHGKAVFVEKPLAITSEDLDRILEVVARTGNDRLMVGFNRRFAPLLGDLHSRVKSGGGPSLVRYLVNAGPLDKSSWYLNADTEGSRFEGEGGHFIDTISWWLDARPIEVHTIGTPRSDDILVNLQFEDDSIASIAYSTAGGARFPKETFEVSGNGWTARVDNFRRATVWTGRRRRTMRSFRGPDKGQRAELEKFLAAVRNGGPMPITVSSLEATTRATLAVTRSQVSGRPEAVQPQ